MTNAEWLWENHRNFAKACMSSRICFGMNIYTREIGKCETDVTCGECLFGTPLGNCWDKRSNWLDKEYVEPEIEIDWERVPIDTPILVSDNEETWFKKHFAGLFDDRIRVWENGNTSWSSKDGMTFPWYYAKLARPEDIEKYRKR